MKAVITTLTTAPAVAVALTACNRGANPSDEVTRSLRPANLNEVSVAWDGSARVAHLKGTVEKPADRERAEEIAAAAVGSTTELVRAAPGVKDFANAVEINPPKS